MPGFNPGSEATGSFGRMRQCDFALAGCPERRVEYFLPGTEPATTCPGWVEPWRRSEPGEPNLLEKVGRVLLKAVEVKLVNVMPAVLVVPGVAAGEAPANEFDTVARTKKAIAAVIYLNRHRCTLLK